MDFSRYIAVTNRKLCTRDFLEQLARVTSLRPKEIILREKDLDTADYENLARQVKSVCDAAGVPLVIHGHPEVAHGLGIRRVQLSVTDVQKYHAEGLLTELDVSVSCHSIEDVRIAESLGAITIVLGTIFETDCKPGLVGCGLEFLESVVQATELPVYAIGGIKPENIQAVCATGAQGGCMMSWFMRY